MSLLFQFARAHIQSRSAAQINLGFDLLRSRAQLARKARVNGAERNDELCWMNSEL